MRDGTTLLADIHRPDSDGRFPALLAASPYPRQMQDLGAPAGFIEAGVTDFWVPRGYVHVIANLRGTCGSGGTFNFFDAQERRDVHDLVEWVAAQPWCDGNVGMIGISYFAMTQLEAAVERPPHLKAIFPLAVTSDLYEGANHHGLLSSSFVTPFLAMMGLTSDRSDKLWRSKPVGLARRVLNNPRVHKKFETANGEAAVTMLRQLLRLPHNPHPWDELWHEAAVKHPTRDEWWEERNLLPLLKEIDIPVYLGCDWENVPLHLPSTFATWKGLSHNACVRMGMLGKFGLTWPWESMHTEALAWYDHWLKGRDTGITDGPPIRYFLPGADEWRTADSWPPSQAPHRELALRADGSLDEDEGEPGSREFMVLGSGLGRIKPSEIDPPSMLTWTSAPLSQDVDVVGDIELRLVASATAIDTAWMAMLQDVGARRGRDRGDRRLVARQLARGRRGGQPARRAGTALPQPAGGAAGRGRRVSNPVGSQRSAVQGRPPHSPDAHQRRPRPVDAGDHELPACQRRHQQPEHGALVVAATDPGARLTDPPGLQARRRYSPIAA